MSTDTVRAVAIAQDALQRLGAVNLVSGHYVRFPPHTRNRARALVGARLADFCVDNCQVCHLGCLLLSYCRLLNGEQSAETITRPSPDIWKERLAIENTLANAFSPDSLLLMEVVFEGADCSLVDLAIAKANTPSEHIAAAITYRERRSNIAACLTRSVLENVIRCDGEFRPWDDQEPVYMTREEALTNLPAATKTASALTATEV